MMPGFKCSSVWFQELCSSHYSILLLTKIQFLTVFCKIPQKTKKRTTIGSRYPTSGYSCKEHKNTNLKRYMMSIHLYKITTVKQKRAFHFWKFWTFFFFTWNLNISRYPPQRGHPQPTYLEQLLPHLHPKCSFFIFLNKFIIIWYCICVSSLSRMRAGTSVHFVFYSILST